MEILADQENSMDLGLSEVYTIALPISLHEHRLIGQKFSNSASQTVTLGFDREATDALLQALLSHLYSSFGSKANPSDILSKDKVEKGALRETKLTDATVIMIGASHAVRIAKELASRGIQVIDLSQPGWVASEASVGALKEKLRQYAGSGSYVVIWDVLSNSTYRCVQEDGTLALPYKSGGKYHLAGRIDICSRETVNTVMHKVREALEDIKGLKVCIPPLPRYLFVKCCEEEGHCEGVGSEGHPSTLLKKTLQVRKVMKEYVVKHGMATTWVPDIVKAMDQEKNSMEGLISVFSTLTDDGGVHLVPEGYRKITDMLVTFVENKMAASISVSAGGRNEHNTSFYWRGFRSPTGSARPKFSSTSYKQNRGGGKWNSSRGSGLSGYSGHSYRGNFLNRRGRY
jgi:hypothetical protein